MLRRMRSSESVDEAGPTVASTWNGSVAQRDRSEWLTDEAEGAEQAAGDASGSIGRKAGLRITGGGGTPQAGSSTTLSTVVGGRREIKSGLAHGVEKLMRGLDPK